MKLKFKVVGLDCPNCAAKLAQSMEKLDGIESAKINFLAEKLTVETTLDEASAFALLSKTAEGFEDGVKLEK